MTQLSSSMVDRIRDQSRKLVRELGFMQRSLADSGLSPSAVHALIEIGSGRAATARVLGNTLLLEKSTVSRLLGNLVRNGLVKEGHVDGDGRSKHIELTPEGTRCLAKIEAFGRRQVVQALGEADGKVVRGIETGLGNYAEALRRARLDEASGTETRAGTARIITGYRPGLIGDIVGCHARFYSSAVSFGAEFEALVARDMAAFVPRLENPVNETWSVSAGGRILGGISIDGEGLGPGIGHLRWFILDTSLRGTGLGRTLMDMAMQFVRQQSFLEVHLWTFDGLDAARTLYERAGFRLETERAGSRWGREVMEQKFVLKL